MIKYSPSVSCGIDNVTRINTIVRTCSVKIATIASKLKDTCINEPSLPNDVFECVNTPISCINTTDTGRWDILSFGCPFYLEQIHPPLRNYYPPPKIVIWILWSSYSFRFLEQSLFPIPVRKVPYPNFYLKQHRVHPVLQMWMHSNCDWYNMINWRKTGVCFGMSYDANGNYQQGLCTILWF